MAAEWKRVMGELAAWQVCAITAVFGSEVPLNPAEINPYRTGPPAAEPEKSEARQEVENRIGWNVLRKAFAGG
jgi:hypothetical protein